MIYIATASMDKMMSGQHSQRNKQYCSRINTEQKLEPNGALNILVTATHHAEAIDLGNSWYHFT